MGRSDANPLTVHDADSSGVLWIDFDRVERLGHEETGRFIEPRIHRLATAAVDHDEREFGINHLARTRKQFAALSDELRRRAVHSLVFSQENPGEIAVPLLAINETVGMLANVSVLQP